MTDRNAPVTRHHRTASERMAARRARGEQIRERIAQLIAERAQNVAGAPASPLIEEPPK